MRPVFISAILCLPGLAFAQSAPSLAEVGETVPSVGDFQLGGAASRAAIVATAPVTEIEPQRPARISLPLSLTREETARTERTFGPATLFVSDGFESGREALELGTFLSRGQATAGLSVTYLEQDRELARSEVFLDYAITDRFSVGLSGILDAEQSDGEPLRQLGVSAEFATSAGNYIQGGFAGAPDYDPVIGLSIGLRF